MPRGPVVRRAFVLCTGAFVHKARLRPLALAYADESRPRLVRIKALAGAVALARALKSEWAGQERVGILLPPTVAAAPGESGRGPGLPGDRQT